MYIVLVSSLTLLFELQFLESMLLSKQSLKVRSLVCSRLHLPEVRTSITSYINLLSACTSSSSAPPDVVPIILRSLLHLAYCPLTISQLCAGSGLMKTLVGVLEGAGHEEETRIMVYQILNEIGKHQPSLIANEV